MKSSKRPWYSRKSPGASSHGGKTTTSSSKQTPEKGGQQQATLSKFFNVKVSGIQTGLDVVKPS